MTHIPLSQIMTKDVKCIEKLSAVMDASELLKEYNCHHIPIIDDKKKVVGIVSSSNIERILTGGSLFKNPKIEEYDNALLSIKFVDEIMTTDITSLRSDDTIQDAYLIFKKNKIRCIPIIDDDVLVGIVTQIDILDYFFESN